MRNAIDNSFILALDLAELLVQEYNIPFRQSHKILALLVNNSEKPEDMLNTEKIENLILDVENKDIEISEDLIQTIKNLDLCLDKRISKGSPSQKEVKSYLDELLKDRESLYNLYLKRIEKIEKSKSIREEKIKELIERI